MDINRYYSSLETRLGNYLLFAGRAHLPYYAPNTWIPFPIHRALLAMEDQIFTSLCLPAGSCVLDAGCGDAQVALYMARRGLRVHAVDVLPRQVEQARRNVAAAVMASRSKLEAKSKSKAKSKVQTRLLGDSGDGNGNGNGNEDENGRMLDVHGVDVEEDVDVKVHQDDYHSFQTVAEGSMDGIYTIETLVHANDLSVVLGELYRVLKPGGSITFFEYDHWREDEKKSAAAAATAATAASSGSALSVDGKVRLYGAISTEQQGGGAGSAGDGGLKGLAGMVARAGFEEVRERDITANIRPLLRVLACFLTVPCLIVVALGIEKYFINTCAVVVTYWRGWKYVAVTARKPEN